MTFDECLLTKHLLDRDRRFFGTVFSRRRWTAQEYSVHLQLKNGQEFEFGTLEEFTNWHAVYRAKGQAARRPPCRRSSQEQLAGNRA